MSTLYQRLRNMFTDEPRQAKQENAPEETQQTKRSHEINRITEMLGYAPPDLSATYDHIAQAHAAHGGSYEANREAVIANTVHWYDPRWWEPYGFPRNEALKVTTEGQALSTANKPQREQALEKVLSDVGARKCWVERNVAAEMGIERELFWADLHPRQQERPAMERTASVDLGFIQGAE